MTAGLLPDAGDVGEKSYMPVEVPPALTEDGDRPVLVGGAVDGEAAGLLGEYAGLLGEYAGLCGEYAGLCGEYAGLLGEYAGLLGEYAGLCGE